MTESIPKRYLKEYQTNPLFCVIAKEQLEQLYKNIKLGKVAVIDDDDYDKLKGLEQ